MRKIRLWIFLGAIWVAKKACYNGLTYDHLFDVEELERRHYNWVLEDDYNI